MRLTVLGGSSIATVQLAQSLATLDPEAEAGSPHQLVLYGRDETRLALVATHCSTILDGRYRVESSRSLEKAVRGADVVLVQIRVGGLTARHFDESFPQRVGLPGEETLGPGGLANALRTVRALRSWWPLIGRVAPEALVIVLTNPAGIVARAALDEGLRVVEVCDSPVALLDAVTTRTGLRSSTVRARYVGMNHIGWYVPNTQDELSTLRELTPIADKVVEAHEALPLHYLRYYVSPMSMASVQAGQPTRASQLMDVELRSRERLGAGSSPERWERPAPWYQLAVVPLLSALMSGRGDTLVLGMANGGRAAWLPAEAIIESPVVVGGSTEFSALPVVELPPIPRALLTQHAVYEQLAYDAAREPSRASVFRAFLANPMVHDDSIADALTEMVMSSDPDLTSAE